MGNFVVNVDKYFLTIQFSISDFLLYIRGVYVLTVNAARDSIAIKYQSITGITFRVIFCNVIGLISVGS